ncbi:hypothetical protein NRB_27950 [Novosphingobium sp. 11B]
MFALSKLQGNTPSSQRKLGSLAVNNPPNGRVLFGQLSPKALPAVPAFAGMTGVCLRASRLFPRRAGLDRHRMDAIAGNVAQRRIYQSLALQT